MKRAGNFLFPINLYIISILHEPHRYHNLLLSSFVQTGRILCYNTMDYATGEVEAGIEEGNVSAVGEAGIVLRGTFLRGFFNSSNVTPSNLVIPTTGASPFLTNSYMPGILLPAKERRRCYQSTITWNAVSSI